MQKLQVTCSKQKNTRCRPVYCFSNETLSMGKVNSRRIQPRSIRVPRFSYYDVHTTMIFTMQANSMQMLNLVLASNTSQETIVRRLLLEVLIEQQRRAFPSKHTRNPGVLVRDAPDGHANTSLDGQAAGSHALVSRNLGSRLLGGDGGVQAHVDLGVDDIDTQVGGCAKRGLENGLFGRWAGCGRSVLGGNVALVANAVDLDAVGLDELDDAGSAGSLRAVELEVVVVVVQLGVAVLLGQLEGDGQVGLADGVVPYAFAIGAVLVQRFVDYIPSGAVVLVAAGKSLDVVLHDLNEGGVGEVAVGHPLWKLRMPDKVVAVDLQLVLLCVVDVAVRVLEGKVAARGLGRLPLLRVLGSDRVEFLLDDFRLSSLVAVEGQGGADEAAAALLHGLVEAVVLAVILGLAGRSNDRAGERQTGDDVGEVHPEVWAW